MTSHSLVGRLRRVTTSGRFIPQVDGLRFVAIAAVVLYHVRSYLLVKGAPFVGDPSRSWSFLFEHGFYGVQLFFAISGFILGLPFATHYLRASKPVLLRAYFLRRLTRLEPPYLLSMLLFTVVLVLYTGKSAAEVIPHLAASLLYVHNLVYGTGSAINGVAWSLEVEIQFYLLVPLLAQLFRVHGRLSRRTVMIVLCAAVMIAQAVLPVRDEPWFRLSVLNQLQFFLVGFLLADIYVSDWNSAPSPTRWWDLVALIGWPLLPLLWTSPRLAHWALPPLILLVYCATFRGPWARRVSALPWITAVGGMCYSIYLLHYPIISFVGRHTLNLRLTDDFGVEFLWQAALITPIVIAVSMVYFVLIEKPCMRSDWPQRLLGRLRRQSVVTPAA